MSRLSYSETRDGILPCSTSEKDAKRSGRNLPRGTRARDRGNHDGTEGGRTSPGTDSLSSYSLMGVADGNEDDADHDAGGQGGSGGDHDGASELMVESNGRASSAVREAGLSSESADKDVSVVGVGEAKGRGNNKRKEAAGTEMEVEVVAEAPVVGEGLEQAGGSASSPISIESDESPTEKNTQKRHKKTATKKAAAKLFAAEEEQQQQGGGDAGSGAHKRRGGDEQHPSKKARTSASGKSKGGAPSRGGDGGGGAKVGGDDDDDVDEGDDGGNNRDHQAEDDGGSEEESVVEEEVAVKFSVGRAMPEEMRPLAKSRLSKWAQKFTKERTYAPPQVPVIEPINDKYLADFGRSYAVAKNMAAQKEMVEGEGGREGDSDGDGDGDGDGDESSGSSDEAGHDDSGNDGGAGSGDGKDDESVSGTEEAGDGSKSTAAAAAAAASIRPAGVSRRLSGGRKKNGILVMNLPYELCEDEKIHEIFGGFGRITSVLVGRVPGGSSRPNGTARLFFSSAEEAEKAMAVKSLDLLGRQIYMKKTQSYEASRYFVEPEEAARVTQNICANCSTAGHKIDQCPHPVTICILCGAKGHNEATCRFNACTICWEEGHLAEACPKGGGVAREPEPCCWHCGQGGHAIEDCTEVGNEHLPPKLSCTSCRDDGCLMNCQGPAMNLVVGNEKGKAKTCCNCGLHDHDRRECQESAESEILRSCGYVYGVNKSALRNGRRKSTGAGSFSHYTCYNCNKTGHRRQDCPDLAKKTQTPGRYGGGPSNHTRNDRPRVPAASWKLEWSARSDRGDGRGDHSGDHSGGRPTPPAYASPSPSSRQQPQPAHLPSSYISELSQKPTIMLPVGMTSPPAFPHRQQSGGYTERRQQEHGGPGDRSGGGWGFPSPDVRDSPHRQPSSLSSFSRWGQPDDGGRGEGGSGFGRSRQPQYHPGGGRGGSGGGGSGRYYSGGGGGGGGDRGGERYSSGGHGGGDRYGSNSRAGDDRGRSGGYGMHSSGHDNRHSSHTPSPSSRNHHHHHHRYDSHDHQRSHDRYGDSHGSFGRRGRETNPRSYGY